MPQHGTALSPGQQKEFLETGLGALVLLSHDPNLDPTTANSWAKQGEAMLIVFRRGLLPSPADAANGVVKTSVIVIGGGRNTDQIVAAAGALPEGRRPGYINPAITQQNMPSGNGKRRPVVVEWFESDHDPTTEEVRARCEESGYGYPTIEDGLRFQEDHPDDQRERPHVVIPENPWCGADGYPRALYLWGNDGERGLDLDYCSLDDGWIRPCVFARRRYLT